MKKKQLAKKSLAVVLSVALLAPTSAFAASPSDFSDFPNDWSTQAMTEAVENGLLGGVTDTTIAPQGKLTRAQMATIINRAFGATAQASLSGYTDVASNAWYYSDMAKAVQMGTFVGVGSGRLNPDAEITREEAFCVLSRAFGIDTASASSLSRFSDSGDVSSWAAEAVAGMIASGYVGGYDDGGLHPKSTITRAEFASVMSRLVETYVSAAGDVSEDVDGNMIVRSADVHLQNMTIDGDLILADGIGTGDVTLEGVSVNGRILIRGGGSNSVHIIDSTIKGGVTLNNPNNVTNIEVENSTMGTVKLQTDAIINGDIENVEVAEGIEVTVASGTVQNMTVSEGAASAAISVADKAGIDKVTVQADDVTIDGEGTVGSVAANADNVAVNTVGTEVTAGEGTSGVTAGGKDVAAGDTVTSDSSSDGDEDEDNDPVTPSRPDPGKPDPDEPTEDADFEVDSWQELRTAVQNAENGDVIRLTDNITDAGSDADAIDGVSSATLPMESEDGKALTLDGDGHSISAADDRTYCFLINTGDSGGTTTVKDLTVKGASNGNKVGGAFFLENGDIVIDNVDFENCGATSASATNGGGALCLNNHGGIPSVTVSDCTFTNCYVGAADAEGKTGRGGAIYANHFNTKPVTNETAVMNLDVENCTFSGNKAAYGGAIAADGNVDLSVSNCTFENNDSAVGADDIYIFEGVSAGKKSMNIYSDVNATLSGNDYTNDTDSTSDMTAMNAIYGRYYPAGYGSEPGTAPSGAQDLLFSDIDRTKITEPSAEVSIAMEEETVAGKTYWVGVAQYGADNEFIDSFTVGGETVNATRIGSSNVYYYSEDPLTGPLYGTDALTYAEFYNSDTTTPAEYDAVSSATTSKNTMFTNADATEPAEGEGYSINGVKNVNVQVDAKQYAEATLLKAVDALNTVNDNGYTKATEVNVSNASAAAPAVYKPLANDGSYGAIVAETKATVNDATLSVETSSNWGDYLLEVTETTTKYLRNGREGEWAVDEDILGAIVTATKDGQTIEVGMKHLENIWVQTYEIAFDIDGDTSSTDTKALEGATINSITYIVPEGQYIYNFTDNNYVKPQYPSEVTLTASVDADAKNVTITGIPADLKDVKVNVYHNQGHGRKTMIVTDQTPNGGVVPFDTDATIESSTEYTVQVSSSNYADLSTSFTSPDTRLDAPSVAGIEFVDEGSFDDYYRMSFSGMEETKLGTYLEAESIKVTVNGEPLTKANSSFWNDKKSFKVSNDDAYGGTSKYIDFTTDVFEADGTYEIEVTVDGYKPLTYTYTKGEVTPGEETKVVNGEATVQTSSSGTVAGTYQAKVKVTYNVSNGTIVSVEDNGTEPGANSSFWEMITDDFWSKFKGLTRGDVDTVDAVSRATVSSNAIKEAVKNALPSNGQ